MKIFKSIFLVSFLLCMFPFGFVAAQLDFRPGYTITNSNDTIKGVLLYKDFNTSKICKFRKGMDDNTTDYSPSDIHAFRFDDGKYYISK